MPVILRTHGGLGNQIFQILYARLIAEKFGLELREVHDLRYKHGFPRSLKLRHPAVPLSMLEKVFSALRLPKVLNRAFDRPELPLEVLGSLYIDGYFQAAAPYEQFTGTMIREQLLQLQSELSIKPPKFNFHLVHLRLGDFFKNKNEAINHVADRLSKLKGNSSIITNDENLLEEPKLASILLQKKCKLIPTSKLTAEQILLLMSTFRYIDANDSTLVFWASILGGCQIDLQDVTLRATQGLFLEAIGNDKGGT